MPKRPDMSSKMMIHCTILKFDYSFLREIYFFTYFLQFVYFLAKDKANLAKEKFKIEQISGYYKIQEAISNAKKAGYELKDDDSLYNLEILSWIQSV